MKTEEEAPVITIDCTELTPAETDELEKLFKSDDRFLHVQRQRIHHAMDAAPPDERIGLVLSHLELLLYLAPIAGGKLISVALDVVKDGITKWIKDRKEDPLQFEVLYGYDDKPVIQFKKPKK
jgi:hypothetical protein